MKLRFGKGKSFKSRKTHLRYVNLKYGYFLLIKAGKKRQFAKVIKLVLLKKKKKNFGILFPVCNI